MEIDLLRACFRTVLLMVVIAATVACSQKTWRRVGYAAKNAVTDPLTWGSAGTAALFAVDGNALDIKVSRWARNNTPVFGSRKQALDASDRLRAAADYGAKLTALLIPSQKKQSEWLWDKNKTLLLESIPASLTLNTTGMFKRSTDRERPTSSPERDSFPSAHSSTAFNDASLGSMHVQQYYLPSMTKNLLSATFFSLGGGTAWARVEGGVHYPSDVLFGAALGNFFAVFFYDAFVRDEKGMSAGPPPISVQADMDGVLLSYRTGY